MKDKERYINVDTVKYIETLIKKIIKELKKPADDYGRLPNNKAKFNRLRIELATELKAITKQ